MAEMTEAGKKYLMALDAEKQKKGQDYLMAVDAEKKKRMARGGQKAADAFIASQKAEAQKLVSAKRGNGENYQTAAQSRLRSNVKTEGPKSPFDPNKDYSKSKDPKTVISKFWGASADKPRAGRAGAADAYRNRLRVGDPKKKVDGMQTYRDRTKK